MSKQPLGILRRKVPGNELTQIWLENPASDAALRPQQFYMILCHRGQIRLRGRWVHDCAKRLLNPSPLRSANMCQDIANVRMPPKDRYQARYELLAIKFGQIVSSIRNDTDRCIGRSIDGRGRGCIVGCASTAVSDVTLALSTKPAIVDLNESRRGGTPVGVG
jgi:hypothetical protein